MPVEGPIWERYDRATRGLPVEETDDFEWMLESPGEFELRVLVRNFEAREELLGRIGRFEHDPAPEFSDAQLEELARSHFDVLQRVARQCDPVEYWWSNHKLKMRLVPTDEPVSEANATRGLFSRVADRTADDLAMVPGGFALSTALQGRVQSLGLFYLLGPLLTDSAIISAESDFETSLTLQKAAITAWVDGDTVFVKRRKRIDRWAEASGWDPQRGWPTDADIADHHEELRQIRERSAIARDPATPAAVLSELVHDPAEAVRSQLTRNPSAPQHVIDALGEDQSVRVLIGLVKRDELANDVLDRALNHKLGRVRCALAKRLDLPTEIYHQLANDPDPNTQRAIATNPKASPKL